MPRSNPKQRLTRHVRASEETIRTRLGLSWSEAARLGDRHTLAVQAWLSTRAPQAKWFEGLGIVAGSSGLRPPFLNLALSSHFAPDSGEAAIDAEIEAVIAFFGNRQVPWTWLLGPFPQPSNMAQRLEARGFVSGNYRLPCLIAPLPAKFPPLNPEIQVWLAQNRADLEAASGIRRIAFRFPQGSALTYFEDMAQDWLRGDPARLYLARVADGPPVAIGALIIKEGVPGVYVMATLPGWEGQGLGKAILARILAQAEQEGHQRIVLTAGQDAYFLYRKFGFEHIFEYGMYYLTD